MAKNNPSENNWEKLLLVVLSAISVALLLAIVYVWYNALGRPSASKPGDFLKTTRTQEEASKSNQTENLNASPSAEIVTQGNLIINSVKDGDVLVTKKLSLSGTFLPQGLVTVTGAKEDAIVVADAAGHFTAPVELDEGENTLTITGLAGNGNQTQVALTVYYLP